MTMKMIQELMSKTRSELTSELDKSLKANRYRHDVAVKFGSVGMSPSQYIEYMKLLDEIEAMNNEMNSLYTR